ALKSTATTSCAYISRTAAARIISGPMPRKTTAEAPRSTRSRRSSQDSGMTVTSTTPPLAGDTGSPTCTACSRETVMRFALAPLSACVNLPLGRHAQGPVRTSLPASCHSSRSAPLFVDLRPWECGAGGLASPEGRESNMLDALNAVVVRVHNAVHNLRDREEG